MEKRNKKEKNPLSYAISPMFEGKIRKYVDDVKKKTGISKSRIVTNLLLKAISSEENFLSQ